MTTLNVLSPAGNGSLILKDSPLGKGGEGAVYAVENHTCSFLPPAEDIVVKTYYSPEENDRQNKVTSMVKSPPESDSVAWPLALVGLNGQFTGYVMKKLDTTSQKEWLYLAHTRERRENAPDFNVKYGLYSCLNLAIAIKSVHEAGHLLGDINESNAFVGADSSVTIVDTDSAQIKGSTGEIFFCGVGKQEYLAPELIGCSLREVPRTEASDAFAFAVMMFQMLTGGAHPTDGRYSGNGDVPSTASRISQNIYPTLRNETSKDFEPVARIAVSGTPEKLQKLMLEILASPPASRPNFQEIIKTLQEVVNSLQACAAQKNHFFDSSDQVCGFCAHVEKGQPDPWGLMAAKPAISQEVLPPISFSDSESLATPPPRVPVNTPKSHTSPPMRRNSPLRNNSNYNSQNNNRQRISNPAPAQSQVPAPPRAMANNIPEKIGWRITVIYPDGSYGIRPSYKDLAGSNQKIFWDAVVRECPKYLKFWWRNDEKAPSVAGIFLGLLTSSLLYILLFFAFLYSAQTILSTIGIWGTLAKIALLLGLLGMLIANIILFIQSFEKRRRVKKLYGRLDIATTQVLWKVISRFAFITFAYLFTAPIVIFGLLRAIWDNQR